jgi:hypothetical protein
MLRNGKEATVNRALKLWANKLQWFALGKPYLMFESKERSFFFRVGFRTIKLEYLQQASYNILVCGSLESSARLLIYSQILD